MHYCTEIVGPEGNTQLESVTWQDKNTGETLIHDIRHLFIIAGTSPRTGWLNGCLALDDKGFILTGRDRIHLCTAGSVNPPFASVIMERFSLVEIAFCEAVSSWQENEPSLLGLAGSETRLRIGSG